MKKNMELIQGAWYPILMLDTEDPSVWSFEETIKAGATRPIERPEGFYCECCGGFHSSVTHLPFDNPEFPNLPDEYVCGDCLVQYYGLAQDYSARPAKIIKGEYFEEHRKNGWDLI